MDKTFHIQVQSILFEAAKIKFHKLKIHPFAILHTGYMFQRVLKMFNSGSGSQDLFFA